MSFPDYLDEHQCDERCAMSLTAPPSDEPYRAAAVRPCPRFIASALKAGYRASRRYRHSRLATDGRPDETAIQATLKRQVGNLRWPDATVVGVTGTVDDRGAELAGPGGENMSDAWLATSCRIHSCCSGVNVGASGSPPFGLVGGRLMMQQKNDDKEQNSCCHWKTNHL